MENLRFKALAGHMPREGQLQRIIAPPYDVVSRKEALAHVAGEPHNLLHVTRADIDLPEGCYAYSEAVYRRAKQNLNHLLGTNFFESLQEDFFVYQVEKGAHKQTGLIALCCNGADFIKTHEKTRIDKLQDRIRLQASLEYQVSPVLMMHRHSEDLAHAIKRLSAGHPVLEATLPDGSVHRVWLVRDTKHLTRELNGIAALYMADGHHRLAASQGVTGLDYVLGAFFSAEELQVLPYHRVLRSTQSSDELLKQLAHVYDIHKTTQDVNLTALHQVSLYLDHTWYALTEKEPCYNDLCDRVPSIRVEKHIVEPLLGHANTTNNPNLNFVGGFDAIERIKELVDDGSWTLGIVLAPIELETIMQMADRGDIMPPKSTWFEPKVADGLILCRA